RMMGRVATGGPALRIALSSSFGLEPVRLQSVQIARPGSSNGTILADSARTVTFGGASAVVLPPGAQITSDPVDFPVAGEADVVVSLYVGADGAATTAHPLGLRAAWLAPGDQVKASQL